ncbi:MULTISPECIES: hypothetical protein [unclassified Curtobacterium]|uniref:hypothetical protein n=1 Tax=unclassified Curtobacterium TaxID=257496 RepID=UPI0008DDF1F9|nr:MULTISPECIES: hypothetical protein [unclassified Curtobacterium]MCT9620580.1 hypothetical protein [Curtobacterium sp. C2H10]OII28913.1 hypothetical protein BIV03_01325 [Curtobacterium sp. MCBA15_016]
MHEPAVRPHSTPTLVVAGAILSMSGTALALLWSVMWVPVLVTGTGASLFLWPLVLALSLLPWGGVVVALVLGVVARRRAEARGSTAVVVASAVLSGLAPIALWFGGPFSAVA